MNITIQAGNTDNKLTQQQFSEFVKDIQKTIDSYNTSTHFFGGSSTWLGWQNVCWCIEITEEEIYMVQFFERLTFIRKKYKQDSIAILKGEPSFI